MTPGNDVMSAILSLLVETLIYGLVILLFVTLLLFTSVSLFRADCPVLTDIYETRVYLVKYEFAPGEYKDGSSYKVFSIGS